MKRQYRCKRCGKFVGWITAYACVSCVIKSVEEEIVVDINDPELYKCTNCKGTGINPSHEFWSKMGWNITKECPMCKGTKKCTLEQWEEYCNVVDYGNYIGSTR
jgi:hypothetical protein